MKKNAHTPLYKTLADKLCDKIAAENLADGDFFCTIKDISTQYDVAVLTVRRAIEVLQNNRIVESKPACGIFIKSIAALDTLRARKNFILIINDHSDGSVMTSYWAMRLCSILQTLSDAGFSIKVASSSEIKADDLLSMKHLLSGVIISASRANLYTDFILDKSSPPVILTRQPSADYDSGNLFFPQYDTDELFDIGCRFFMKHKKKKVVIVNFDSSGFKMPSDIDGKYDLIFDEIFFDGFPAVQCGTKIAADIRIDDETALWVQDDFTALGIHTYFLSKGIDLTVKNALLVTAGPSVGMTEQMKLPVIGFCPWESGKCLAQYLTDIISGKNPKQPLIAPICNSNVK